MDFFQGWRVLRKAGVSHHNLIRMPDELIIKWAKHVEKGGKLPEVFFQRWDAPDFSFKDMIRK